MAVAFLYMSTNAALSQGELGKRLLLSRRDLGWNQDDLAEKSGISRGYISNIERGRITNVGVEVVFALAEALEVTPAYLLGLVDDPLANVQESALRESGPGHHLDPLDEELLEIVQQFDRDQKRTFLEFARTILRPNKPRIIGGE